MAKKDEKPDLPVEEILQEQQDSDKPELAPEPEPEKPKEKPLPQGVELDILRKNSPKEYKKVVKLIGEQTKNRILKRLESSTDYPDDTVRDWNMVIKAIDRGIWHPTTPQLGPWRPPKRMTAYDRFMNS